MVDGRESKRVLNVYEEYELELAELSAVQLALCPGFRFSSGTGIHE